MISIAIILSMMAQHDLTQLRLEQYEDLTDSEMHDSAHPLRDDGAQSVHRFAGIVVSWSLAIVGKRQQSTRVGVREKGVLS